MQFVSIFGINVGFLGCMLWNFVLSDGLSNKLFIFRARVHYSSLLSIVSGQIIATSHDLTPKGSWEREIPLFQGNLGWWNIIIWPDCVDSIDARLFYFDILDVFPVVRHVFR